MKLEKILITITNAKFGSQHRKYVQCEIKIYYYKLMQYYLSNYTKKISCPFRFKHKKIQSKVTFFYFLFISYIIQNEIIIMSKYSIIFYLYI